MESGGLPSLFSMKLPSVLEQFLPKKAPTAEVISSLVLDEEYAAAALWEMDGPGKPHILAVSSEPVTEDSWESRLDAVDVSLASVEDAVGTTKYTKVVLGLPPKYLTAEGEILHDIRPHIKTITKELELTPIGFVSLPQAILYKLKKEEGIPPSVILLGVSKKELSVSLYRVGALTGQSILPRSGDMAINLEEALRQFKNLEVLPARILLYGHDAERLGEVKTELLRYPWTTRVNFLHFPKIEIITPKDVVASVSLAGASELAHEVDQQIGQETDQQIGQEEEPIATPEANEEILESQAGEVEVGEEITAEESNVVAVDPANLGFRKNVDVLEDVEKPSPRPMRLPAIVLPYFDISAIRDRIMTGGKGPIIAVAAAILILFGLLYWFVPHANVTVLTRPKSIVESENITIDPKAKSVDATGRIIPGTVQEKSVSGQKTIPVTGKKNVGDPARGTVTIYNKTTDAKTFVKGAVLTSGTLQFTLDADVQVASASEAVGSITFGKTTGTITASQIGTDSNLPAAAEFHFKDYDTGVAIARNDAALSGGTSKSVTVVTRADYDAFIKAISDDLVGQAKKDLGAGVRGSEKLIDETITSTVTQKTYSQELDQEATELSGNATITVSGTSYNEDDVKTIMKAFITGAIPAGYTLAESRTQVTLENVKVLKDGSITAKATIKTDAIPSLDLTSIRNHLAGKKISDAEAYLRTVTGVAGMNVGFSLGFGHGRLPLNGKNINVSLAIQ